jgi:hypothetical protein
MDACLDYIDRRGGEEARIMRVLHELMTSFPAVSSKIRYTVPFYGQHSWICYLSPQKKGGVEMCFVRARALSNARDLLDFKDRSEVAGVFFETVRDIPMELVTELVMEALLVDEDWRRRRM